MPFIMLKTNISLIQQHSFLSAGNSKKITNSTNVEVSSNCRISTTAMYVKFLDGNITTKEYKNINIEIQNNKKLSRPVSELF